MTNEERIERAKQREAEEAYARACEEQAKKQAA